MELHRIDTDQVALEELEPSPIDETPSKMDPASKDYFPPPRRSTTTLGISTQRIPYYLQQTHKYSSLVFLAFTTAHITNTSLLPLLTRSVPASNSYLLLTRPYYQSLPMEPLLITIPLAAHIISGFALRLHRRHVLVRKSGASTPQDKARVPWPRVSAASALGYAAVPLVLGHSALTRMLPLWVEGGSSGIGLDYVGHGVAVAPTLGYVGFAALVGVVGTHVVWGIGRWMNVGHATAASTDTAAQRSIKRRQQWGLNAVAALVVGLWSAGGIGIIARGGRVPGWVGKSYDDLLRRVPVLARYV